MTKRKEIVKENTHMGARFFMIYLMFSLSFFTASAFSIDESSIIESPQYRTAQVDFETDEPALSLINVTGPNMSTIFDISDEPSLTHTIIIPELEPDSEYTYSLFAITPSGEESRVSSRQFRTTREQDLTLDFYGNIPEIYNDALFRLQGRT